jgi:hypothetical protein
MTSSGTYTFEPAIGETVLYAFNLIGVRPTSVLQEHLQFSRMAANMLLSRWSNQGVNLWAVDLVTTPLVQGTSTYDVDASTVMILDAYVTTGTDPVIDRIISPISRSEYASYPDKTMQGFPTIYWFDRLLSPTITIWPVPDGSQVNLKYYRVRQLQDAALTNGQTANIPYLWQEAFAEGLAYRFARAWNPQMAPMLKGVADEAYAIAAAQNIEQSAFYVSPMISGYYR